MQDVEALVKKYITSETTIILAMAPATADIETSKGIGLAKTADPTGRRTIGER